jgi:hypothetical protein
LPRLGDVLAVVVVLRDLVPGNHGARCQRLELVERLEPFE